MFLNRNDDKKNINNDYPGLLDQVIAASQTLRVGNSRVILYCRNHTSLVKIALTKTTNIKNLNYQHLTCHINDRSSFKLRLLNYGMPVVMEYEVVKMAKEIRQKEFDEFEAKAKEIEVKQFEREIDHPFLLNLEEDMNLIHPPYILKPEENQKYGMSPIKQALNGIERKMELTVDNLAVDVMSGIIPLEQPIISNGIEPPKCFGKAIARTNWKKEKTEEIDINQCLEEALIQIRNPPEQQPLYTGTMAKIINRGLNRRMIANDTNPTPLAMKPMPEKTELTAKCALCGEPCKPRNGAKFYSHCVGGCK